MAWSAQRDINNTFFTGGTPVDGIDGIGKFIDCDIISNINNLKATGRCSGISIGSTSDSADYANIKYKPRGSNQIIEQNYALGLVHPIDLKKLYKATTVNARDVTLHFK